MKKGTFGSFPCLPGEGYNGVKGTGPLAGSQGSALSPRRAWLHKALFGRQLHMYPFISEISAKQKFPSLEKAGVLPC